MKMLHFHKSSLIPAGPSSALHLHLRGFSQNCQTASLSEILSLVNLLPNFHLSGLREIEFLNETDSYDHLLARNFPTSHQLKAEFVQHQRKILIFNIRDRDVLFHVFLHEIGHFVYSLVISSTLKHYWVSQVFPGSRCVTPYGESDAAEDFAETYAYYILAPEMLRTIPAKFSFMRHLVFSGAPITLKEKTMQGFDHHASGVSRP